MKFYNSVLLLSLASASLLAAVAFADNGTEDRPTRRPIAQCYNPNASNRSGAGTILKLKLDMLRTKSGSQIIAGLGVDMIPASNSAGFPAIFTTGGTFSRNTNLGDRTSLEFDRGGSYKYLDVDSQPLVVRSITLDRRQGTVSIDIAPGFAGRTLVAKGCRFF